MRGRDAYERGDLSLRGSGGRASGGSRRPRKTPARRSSHSYSHYSKVLNLILVRNSTFSNSSLRLILTSHRSSHLTFSVLQKDRSIDYSTTEVVIAQGVTQAARAARRLAIARVMWTSTVLDEMPMTCAASA